MTYLKLSRRLTVAIALVGLAMICTLTQHHQQRQQMRRDILALRETYLQLVHNQNMGLKNQFTPGCKSPHIFRAGIVFKQGNLFKSQTPTHLAVNGLGVFGLRRDGVTRYTRDGRFEFRDGLLSNAEGWRVLGYTRSREPGELQLRLDPVSRLYGGKYTSFHFDETGCCYGERRLTDPVTGQTITFPFEPLFQVALYHLPNPEAAESPNLLKGDVALAGRAGEGTLGGCCPGYLEMSTVDILSQAFAVDVLNNSTRWFTPGLSASPIQTELARRLEWDPQIRQACFDNLRFGLEPGYRSTDILPWLCDQSPAQVNQKQGTLFQTECADDLVVDGEGYFLHQDGRWSHTANLSQDRLMGEKWLGKTFADELSVVTIPPGASNLEVSGEGVLSWALPGGNGRNTDGYRLRLGQAPRVVHEGSLVRPDALPQYGIPGKEGFGIVAQGYLEMSNEDPYQRRIVGAALMEWAGMPLLPETPERQPNPAMMANPYHMSGFDFVGVATNVNRAQRI